MTRVLRILVFAASAGLAAFGLAAVLRVSMAPSTDVRTSPPPAAGMATGGRTSLNSFSGQAGGGLRLSQAVLDAERAEESENPGHEETDKAENPDGLLRERVRQRAGAEGRIEMGALLRAKERVDAMRREASRSEEAGEQRDGGIWAWQRLGPGNIGGRVRAIVTHPSDSNLLLLGSVSGGIWKSVDGGNFWFPVDDFMANLAVTSLVRDPMNPNRVYAATGEGFSNFDAVPGAGIFRSDDGGTTWSNLASTNTNNFRWVNRLAVDPNTSGVVYAAAVGSGGSGAIYKTTDGGATWTNVKNTFGSAFDVKTHPSISGRVLAASNGGVYLSTDGGATWTDETAGGNQLPLTNASNGRIEVAFATNATHMYASMQRSSGEVWRSADGGATWAQRNASSNYLGTQGWYDNAIWVDPTNAERILVGGIDLYRSIDGGANLTRISDWQDYHNPGNSAHADQHAIVPAIDFSTSQVIYVGNDGGIQRNTASPWTMNENQWTNLANGLAITQFYGGAAAPDGSVIVGGAQDNDQLRYRSIDPAGQWYQAEPGDGGFAAMDFDNPSVIYGEYIQLQIEKSTNGGDSYTRVVNGLGDAGGSALFIAPFRMDPNDSDVLIAGGSSIWRTTDAAGNWSSVRGPQGGELCSAMEISRSSSHYWVGYDSGRVSRSTDGGASWTDVDNNGVGLPNRWITDIAVSPWNDNEVFVTLAGYNADPVWYSSDGGTTWANRSGSAPYQLPSIQANAVVFHPVDTNWVYVGTDLGMFASEDRGISWSVTAAYGDTEGPANVEVSDLFFYGDQWLVAATHGRGMFRCRPRETYFVDGHAPGGGDGSQSSPFQTIGLAEIVRGPGANVSVAAGDYDEGPLILSKRGFIVAAGGVVNVR